MQLINPTVTTSHASLSRAPALTTLENCTIGILSNGKLNADSLLVATARRLQERFGGKILDLAHKSNPSAPAPGDTLTNLSPECDYLLTATGD